LFGMMLGMVSLLASGAMANPIVVQHSGATDPSTEGFTGVSGIGGSATAGAWNMNDNSTSVDARRIYPGSAPINNLFDAGQAASFAADGWKATWTVQVVSSAIDDTDRAVETSVTVQIGGINYRYILRLARTPGTNGPDLYVAMIDDAGSPPVTYPGLGAAYHTYELSAPAGTNVATLTRDGVFVTTTNGLAASAATMYWGSVTDPAMGESNWSLVQFAVQEPVPEPASLALLSAGLAGLLRRRRR
jgi:hypothetical protein